MKLILKTITNYTKKEKVRLLWAVAIVFVVIVVDQLTKNYVATHFRVGESVRVIDGFFNFTYVRNQGAAFGFGSNFANTFRYLLFLAVPVIACFWLLWLILTAVKDSKLLFVSYALILGGAVGNLIDRFVLDYVVDFFDFYYKNSHFATFNVADSAISVAAGLLILDFLLNHKKASDKSKNTVA